MKYLIFSLLFVFSYSQVFYEVYLFNSAKVEECNFSPDKLYRHYVRGIPLDFRDFPIRKEVVDELRNYGRVHIISRWFNAIIIESSEENINKVKDLPFVSFIRRVCPVNLVPTEVFNYGGGIVNVRHVNLDTLHRLGYTGKNVKVGVFDSGFPSVDTMSAYDSIRSRSGFIYVYDYYSNNSNVYDDDWHGTYVLSVMGANLPGVYVGAAPHANFFLARTEVVAFERHLEEWNWVRAAEKADSLGIDVINSSLGYSIFDPGEGDYTYNDMDGNTAIITRAADIAASKGIVVVTSAGNEGSSSWQKITAPCDGDSVLCVGAVATDSLYAAFSSQGPTSDGRLKPDVVALGWGTKILTPFGVTASSGTSFSSPLVAGLVACLLQAVPYAKPMEVIYAVKYSAHKKDNPDTLYGFGIPDAIKALNILKSIASVSKNVLENKPYVKAFIKNDNLVFTTFATSIKDYTISIYDITGKQVVTRSDKFKTNFQYSIPIEQLTQGLYVLRIQFSDNSFIFYKFAYY